MKKKNFIELEKKINEFFCDPAVKTDQYRKLSIRNLMKINATNEQIHNEELYKFVRFSPLYNILRETFFCLGINPETGYKNFNKKRDFGPANLAAVVLEGTICEMLAGIKYQKLFNPSVAMRDEFNKNYLKLSKFNSIAIRLIRNAVLHANYGLVVFKNPRYNPFNKKVFFLLSRSKNFDFSIRKIKNRRKYPAINFIVNPIILFEKILVACQKLEKEILSLKNPILSEWFLKNIRRKHWINY